MSKETAETDINYSPQWVLDANVHCCEVFVANKDHYMSTLSLIAPGPEGQPPVNKLDQDCDDINRAMLDKMYEIMGADLSRAETTEATPENSEYARRVDFYQRLIKIPTSTDVYFFENFTRHGDWSLFDVKINRDTR